MEQNIQDNILIHYIFKNKNLLTQALTHKSIQWVDNNERLELLGDAVLNFVMTEYLFIHYPHLLEGEISQARANLVCINMLKNIAHDLNLKSYIRVNTQQHIVMDNIIANAVEAIIGAVFCDSDIKTCQTFIHQLYTPYLTQHIDVLYKKDPKTELQEYCQYQKLGLPKYILVLKQGPVHQLQFTVSCTIKGKKVQCVGGSIKCAEKKVAQKLLHDLQHVD